MNKLNRALAAVLFGLPTSNLVTPERGEGMLWNVFNTPTLRHLVADNWWEAAPVVQDAVPKAEAAPKAGEKPKAEPKPQEKAPESKTSVKKPVDFSDLLDEPKAEEKPDEKSAAPYQDALAANKRGDYATALHLFHSLAENGNAQAQHQIGVMYFFGDGVPKDYAEAVKWLRRAAEQGVANAQLMLGYMYDNGLGVGQNFAEAAKWFRSAAEQGAADAQFMLGAMYDEGLGVDQDFAEAAKWYRRAAEQGNALAQTQLGVMCARGEGVPKDDAEAMKWFRRAAEQGNDAAQLVLGTWYDEGRRVPSNFAEAMKWYRLAAEQGNAGAQLNLGVMYAHGKGIPRNDAEAAKWYQLAADRGLANAQDALGSLYFLGEGVPKSCSQAVKWFRLAADQGYAAAQKHLGLTYAWGDGIPQNYIRAYMWLSLAAAQDDKDAATQRDKVAQLMTPSQVAEAQRLALGWQPLSTKGSPDFKPEASAASSGTAFFVSDKGEALTNAHVVEGCQKISVGGTPARLLARDEKNDLALLGTDHRPAQWAYLRQSAKLGEDIVVYGFPLSGVLSSRGNVVTGNITALAGLGDDSRFLQISAPVQPGNSGGPLLDRHGDVVGVVVAKLNAVKIASATGDIPQNVNFAIKASVAAAFLEAHQVPLDTGFKDVTLPLSTPEIAARAQALTAQVICTQ